MFGSTNTLAGELVKEGERRFEYLRRLTEAMKGMSIPFTSNELKKRTNEVCPFNTALDALWNTGVIGAHIATYSSQIGRNLKGQFEDETYRFYKIGNRTVHVWSLFVYNWDGDYGLVVDDFRKQDSVESSYILHPIMFRYLLAHVKSDWPIGT